MLASFVATCLEIVLMARGKELLKLIAPAKRLTSPSLRFVQPSTAAQIPVYCACAGGERGMPSGDADQSSPIGLRPFRSSPSFTHILCVLWVRLSPPICFPIDIIGSISALAVQLTIVGLTVFKYIRTPFKTVPLVKLMVRDGTFAFLSLSGASLD